MERIQTADLGMGVSYVYFDGTTKIVDGVEIENMIFLDSDFNRLIKIEKNAVVDSLLATYRLKGLNVKRTPVADSYKKISLQSAIWLETPESEKNKYRLLLIKQDVQQVFGQAKIEIKKYNPKKDNSNKFLLR